MNETIYAWFVGYYIDRAISDRRFDTTYFLIWRNTSTVGCAIVQFQVEEQYLRKVICTNFLPEFEFYDTECQTGMNPKYHKLCNEREFETDVDEAPPVTEWIKNGKKLGANICTNPTSKQTIHLSQPIWCRRSIHLLVNLHYYCCIQFDFSTNIHFLTHLLKISDDFCFSM